MRLINEHDVVTAILREIDKIQTTAHGEPCKYGAIERGGLRKALRCIEQAPTVDAVPVVRCRDCAEDGRFTCPLAYIENHTLCFVDHSPNFFCAAGERKEGAE